MSHAVSTKLVFPARENLRDEVSCRRPGFRAGNEIRLSDGQEWVFPAHPENSERRAALFAPAYVDIIYAILDAEDKPARCIAELAFAIFLLDYNYRLSPADYERLLGSNTSSRGSGDWQDAFHRIANQHVLVFLNTSCD
jgi:hypothetical protein